MDIHEKISCEAFDGEWRQILNREVMNAVARKVADYIVGTIDVEIIDLLADMVDFPGPLTPEILASFVEEPRTQWSDLALKIRTHYGMTAYDAGQQITTAVKQGVLFLHQDKSLKYLTTSPAGTTGVEWEGLVGSAWKSGPELVEAVMSLRLCTKSRAYQLIEKAITDGFLIERKQGRTRSLRLKNRVSAAVAPVTAAESSGPCPVNPPREFIDWNDGEGDPTAEAPWEYANEGQKTRAWAKWLKFKGESD